MAQIAGQSRGADGASIVKLNLIWQVGCTKLTLPLQSSDRIDERGLFPGLQYSLSLGHGDVVSRRLFHHAEAVEFQLTKNRGLS